MVEATRAQGRLLRTLANPGRRRAGSFLVFGHRHLAKNFPARISFPRTPFETKHGTSARKKECPGRKVGGSVRSDFVGMFALKSLTPIASVKKFHFTIDDFHGDGLVVMR